MKEQQTFQHKDQLIERGQRDCIMHAPHLFGGGGLLVFRRARTEHKTAEPGDRRVCTLGEERALAGRV